MRPTTLKTALALGIGLTTLGGWSAVRADDAPIAPAANGPGPATQPPPAPGTTQPAPTQPAAPPTPPGTAEGASPAPAAPAPTPPNYGIQYNGLIDGYYLFNFNNPKDSGGTPSAGHYYDVRHDSPALSLAELNVYQNAKPHGIGFKTTLITGDTADLNHGGLGVTNGEGRYKNVQQLYGTYSFSADGAGVDVGKFYTPFGYEVTESNGNYNYSRSLPFSIAPTYHAGARIYTPVPGLAAMTATLYLVQAIYNTATTGVQNDAKRAGYIGQLNYTDPKGKFTAISELGLGSQKFTSADPTPTKVVLNDNNFTYNFNANMLAGLDYQYLQLKPNSGGKTTTNAYAVYYHQTLTPKTAFALRFSGYDAKFDDGAGDISHSRPTEVTGTYEIKPAANFTTRFEYRHDSNNNQAFLDKDSNPTKKNQDTVEVAGIFTF